MKPRQHVVWNPMAQLPYTLNLSEGFEPLVGKTIPLEFKKFNFFGGEPHFQILTQEVYDAPVIITQRYNRVSDLFDIILANDALRRFGVKNISLIFPYFPAARQDRVCNEGEPLTIKIFTDLINGCNFDKVTILCPHSEVTPALLNNVEVLDELDFVLKAVSSCPYTPQFNIVCPDAGAGKRVGKVVKHLFANNDSTVFNLIRCEKERDVKDGSLKGFYVQADHLGGYPTLIVDDINSMAGTFIGLGKELKKKNCGKLMLFTSHSDCVEGIFNARKFFDHVFTTNSKRDWVKALKEDEFPDADNFTCMKLVL